MSCGHLLLKSGLGLIGARMEQPAKPMARWGEPGIQSGLIVAAGMSFYLLALLALRVGNWEKDE